MIPNVNSNGQKQLENVFRQTCVTETISSLKNIRANRMKRIYYQLNLEGLKVVVKLCILFFIFSVQFTGTRIGRGPNAY